MKNFLNVLSKIGLFIILVLSILCIGIYSAQQSLTKDFIASLLDETKTSELMIHYSDDETRESYISIHDYIYKSLDRIGIDENIINNNIFSEYIESLSDAILTDVLYNYLNEEKMIINNQYEEVNEIGKLLTDRQQQILDQTIIEINEKITNYLDETFEQNQELKFVKIMNNYNVKTMFVGILVTIVLVFIFAKSKQKALKGIINIMIGLIVMMLLFHLTYKYFLSDIIVNLEKYGNAMQIFFNNFIQQIGKIWKIMLIIVIPLLLFYLLIKYISKRSVKSTK